MRDRTAYAVQERSSPLGRLVLEGTGRLHRGGDCRAMFRSRGRIYRAENKKGSPFGRCSMDKDSEVGRHVAHLFWGMERMPESVQEREWEECQGGDACELPTCLWGDGRF